jgi:hypothetical protein
MNATKKISLVLCIQGIVSITGVAQSNIQDSTGLPGDHFSLQGALTLFQQATSPEDFEKLLNDEKSQVNNLDLNEDGQTDYIKVVAKKDENNHLFVLQVPVSENENQDIAVIEIEKTGAENAVLQIIGDSDIYGEEVIVEPSDGNNDNEDMVPGNGPSIQYKSFFNRPFVVVNVWLWPSVRYVYALAYVGWYSPWHWHKRPIWYKPWRPFSWHVWHPYRTRYYKPTVRVVHVHRVIHVHHVYRPTRVYSSRVRTRNATVVNNYRVTRSKTVTTKTRGRRKLTHTTTVQKQYKHNKHQLHKAHRRGRN